jgi:hypothetical protein
MAWFPLRPWWGLWAVVILLDRTKGHIYWGCGPWLPSPTQRVALKNLNTYVYPQR